MRSEITDWSNGQTDLSALNAYAILPGEGGGYYWKITVYDHGGTHVKRNTWEGSWETFKSIPDMLLWMMSEYGTGSNKGRLKS